jgi:hypothetical protein
MSLPAVRDGGKVNPPRNSSTDGNEPGSRSHWKDVQEKLLGLKTSDRTKTDTGRRDE